MFDFLFKRRRDVSSTNLAPVASGSKPHTNAETHAGTNPGTNANPGTSAPALPLKQLAISRAQALDGDEALALEFLLNCEFADARAIAAQHIQSPALLGRALAPMRKSDRRVARLLQQRLDALAQADRTAKQVESVVAQAQRLLALPQLLPNHIVDLDACWQAIAARLPQHGAAYDPLRAALGDRLLAQSALQRTALDTLARLQQLQRSLTSGAALPPAEEFTRAMTILEGAMENHFVAPEAASLPRQLRQDFEQQRAELHASWEQLEACSVVQATVDAAAASVVADAITIEPEQSAAATRIKSKETRPAKLDLTAFERALESMTTALEQGSLHLALECERDLRQLAPIGMAVPAVQARRLQRARTELMRLQDWASWGGTISRIELLTTAQELTTKNLPLAELAKQVGALRARWKLLNNSAGAASPALWQQFDIACSSAYAPAAAHFAELAEQRQARLQAAEALITQVQQFVASSQLKSSQLDAADSASVNWKAVAQFSSRSQDAWRRLGTLDRKQRKGLQSEFDNALQQLLQPLALQQAREIRVRQGLIDRALALDVAARDTPDRLRALQQQWQQSAQALPLAARDEESLWGAFRAAGQRLFAQRKEALADAEQRRQANAATARAWCSRLEAVQGEDARQSVVELRNLLADSKRAWSKIGPLPQKEAASLQQRHEAVQAALQQQVKRMQQAAQQRQFDALRGKLALCQQQERDLVTPGVMSVPDPRWQQEWVALPVLSTALEAVLGQRFLDGQAAWTLAPSDAAVQAWIEQLPRNADQLRIEVLRLEIINGIASPAALARERLQLQVEVLATRLKQGGSESVLRQQLLNLCGLAALTDDELGARIEHILRHIRDQPRQEPVLLALLCTET